MRTRDGGGTKESLTRPRITETLLRNGAWGKGQDVDKDKDKDKDGIGERRSLWRGMAWHAIEPHPHAWQNGVASKGDAYCNTDGSVTERALEPHSRLLLLLLLRYS